MGGLLTGPASDSFQGLFIPSVCLLIAFLGYSSQWLFNTTEYLEPGPMTKRETTILNILLVCIWSTYYKACTVPPGRYHFPDPTKLDKSPTTSASTSSSSPSSLIEPSINHALPVRWCKKCAAPKPLRAHHCRHCGTCIPKMDHHCPWTANCVSLQTFPHFLRFLLYTNLTLGYLHTALLYPRFRFLFWDHSRLPAYLGPSVPAMIHLTLLGLVGTLTSVALGVLLITSVRSWVLNQTMIEGWEIERHDAVLARAKRTGGYWQSSSSSSSSSPLRIERVEFPYDIDFFANMAQAMGTRNVLAWLDPFVGSGPVVGATAGKGVGWEWEENGFNDREGMWPPTDPDKMRRGVKNPQWAEQQRQEIVSLEEKWRNPEGEIAAFRARQEMDMRRRRGESGVIAELEGNEDLEDLEYEYIDGDSGSGGGYDYYDDKDDDDDDEEAGLEGHSTVPGKPLFEQGIDGEPGWTNAEGDRLRDYGVDEDAEDSDDDVPLGELLRRRKAFGSAET